MTLIKTLKSRISSLESQSGTNTKRLIILHVGDIAPAGYVDSEILWIFRIEKKSIAS